MKSASDSILRRIRAKQQGWVFTPKDFLDFAARSTIDVTLYRLLKKGIIRKLSHGIYDLPIKHPKLGILAADPDAIAKAIATKKGDVIQPGNAQLANQFGFDTQVPAKPTYITSGRGKQKNIASYPIGLNHSKFLSKFPMSVRVSQIISVLDYMGKNNITDAIINKCKNILSVKDKAQLKNNLNQVPGWMIPYILKIIGKKDEGIVASNKR